jgi:hypothetical protein
MKTTIAILLAGSALLSIPARAGAGEVGNDKLVAALKQLNPSDDKHWTADGQPRIDIVKQLAGDQSITREAIDKAAPGFTRTSIQEAQTPPPQPPAQHDPIAAQHDPIAAAEADGWIVHPTAEGYHYKGQDVVLTTELATRYPAPVTQSAPSGGGQGAEQASEPAQDQARDISDQTGMGGAMTARSPEPVEGQRRETHVELESQGRPGERPIGVVQGTTDLGHNALGTPETPVNNAGRAIELSGEVQARNAGSVLIPAQAPANASNSETISLGGAADPAVEARAAGGAVIAEGAGPATFLEGSAEGGPFGHSGITAGDGPGQAKLTSVDHGFEGDPDEVAAGEAELEEASARTAELRAKLDELSAELHTSLRTEAAIRRRIEANRPQSGNMVTIQSFLQSQQDRRAAAVRDAKK